MNSLRLKYIRVSGVYLVHILFARLKIIKREKDFSLKLPSTYLCADLIAALSSLQMYDFPHLALFLELKNSADGKRKQLIFFLVLSDSSFLP